MSLIRRRHSYSKISLSASGDTIVEVLIAIAIVSTVLAGAFGVTQKSTIAVRDSQERAQMLQILQGQVELTRAIAVGDTTVAPGGYDIYQTPPKYFCIDPNTKQPQPYGGATPTLPANDPGGGVFPNACKNIANLYTVAIKYDGATNTFTYLGWWDKLGNAPGRNTVQLSYRISPST